MIKTVADSFSDRLPIHSISLNSLFWSDLFTVYKYILSIKAHVFLPVADQNWTSSLVGCLKPFKVWTSWYLLEFFITESYLRFFICIISIFPWTFILVERSWHGQSYLCCTLHQLSPNLWINLSCSFGWLTVFVGTDIHLHNDFTAEVTLWDSWMSFLTTSLMCGPGSLGGWVYTDTRVTPL